jgi:hypothetical protein
MSFSVTDAFVNQYSGMIRHNAQQKYARLRPAVYEEPLVGESLYLEYLAPTAARKSQARHEDSPIMNSQHLRRRLSPYSYKWGDLIDKEDKVRMLIDPTSPYSLAGAYAMQRGVDDELIGGMWATAYAGHAGNTSITWPNGSGESTPSQPAGKQIAVNDWSFGNGSGNAGLTISKVISGRVALLAGEGDEDEEVYIACSGVQFGNMLATAEFTSGDYSELKALSNKKWHGMSALGVTWLHSERLQLNASGYRRVPMWRKSGIGLGVASDISGRVGERPDKSFSWQVYADMVIGAARMEEVKLVELVCSES